MGILYVIGTPIGNLDDLEQQRHTFFCSVGGIIDFVGMAVFEKQLKECQVSQP